MSNTTTLLPIRIPPQGLTELQQLAEHAEKLREALEVIEGARLDTKPSDLRQLIAERIGTSADVAGLLLSGLASLRSVMQQADSTATDLISRVSASLPKTALWREKTARWENSKSLIISALESISADHPLLLRQKALELTYAHQNIFKRSQIMTDLRPVFNSAGDTILAMVLTHVLSIEYFDGVRMQRTEFALDEDDVENLRKATERATVKTQASKHKFKKCDLLLIVAGDTSKAD